MRFPGTPAGSLGRFPAHGPEKGRGSPLVHPGGQCWQGVPEAVPPARPERRRRREANRQKTLAQRKQALPPPPAQERYTHSEYFWIGGFRSWTAATVPIAVVCLRDHYADGHHDAWALMSTYCGPEPLRLLSCYRRRPAIEERHRQLKCFYDLCDFRSRSFNAIAAQVVMVLLTYTLRQMATLEVSGGSLGPV
jgi:hypothetical protein